MTENPYDVTKPWLPIDDVGGTGAITLSPKDLKDMALQMPPGVITATGTNATTERDVKLATDDDNQCMGVFAFGETIVEIRKHCEDLPEDAKIGLVGFAEGVAYIKTRHGWINLGDALTMPNPRDSNNNRRAAVEATKRKRAKREKND